MSTPPPPCRLYFILARKAPIGVIFRRGPSKWVQLIKWRTDTDSFEEGQWFHGRVNEETVDLSPSGDKLLYSAYRYSRKHYDPEIGFAWTAISKPPYFTALALWPCISAGFGGGLFDSEQDVRIWFPWNTLTPAEGFEPADHLTYSTDWLPSAFPDPKVRQHLHRDGWNLSQEWRGQCLDAPHYYVTNSPERWEKPLSVNGPTLKMTLSISNFKKTVNFFVMSKYGAETEIEGAGWADWDQAERLVFAAEGKLFAGTFGPEGLSRRELADFNPNKPKPVEAPDWAKHW